MDMNTKVFPASIAIFCQVIDNFGDIGVCWRLARQLTVEHGINVCLVLDNLQVLNKIGPPVCTRQASQTVEHVKIIGWNEWSGQSNLLTTDVVVEAFGCSLPDDYLKLFATRANKPIWINLEYLSAESWVDGFHGMASPHAIYPLCKHFFFPGFSNDTGGLLREIALLERRDRFQQPSTVCTFFGQFHSSVGYSEERRNCLVVSLFCYPDAPVQRLFTEWENGTKPVICLVPEGVAAETVEAFLGQKALPGTYRTRGNLTVEIFALMKQVEYDHLLWACDVNFVRGEDSFVRAQFAGKPMIWQIYPQADDAHWSKLDAFVARYTNSLDGPLRAALANLHHAWNGMGDVAFAWNACLDPIDKAPLSAWHEHARSWSTDLAQESDLATRLIQFIQKLG